ncbi:hypothetical protein SERLA73DRAFT_119031 [Serpula lacrymans var. lacrymans S7.3]|uniref:Uncharacterized protein n=2 Tax=Serpula lacrymans var. lacrymans TaxID=341189 RepID=F8PJM8_SERL3|nr:uncharacterized protein SERLADRAFT_365081 [Serpula lacrymans var. lacrymans S7.9]EGO03229.1 hypothetical protein SERLA73DRAFT_119031 [Serpula lacrymans var. lacrymans S7.3]EGO29013.1 hypothetical protein SERLADRAFT_365081 [Serpula lacrymans var. lacrymans S7.9]
MHLIALNIPDLLINLWRYNFDCEKTDSKHSWDWGVLQGDTWKQHGQAIADSTPYLPGPFDCPPRNPAEKISSGYKAWEFLLYVYGLAPAFLYNVLPEKYWRNFCKLVFSVQIFNQHHILTVDLQQAHKRMLEFTAEFEVLYYQQCADQLHFVRLSLHTAQHLGPEVRTIGNLGQEIRQPSNPYANLSQRGLLLSQINALKAMIPSLSPPTNPIPKGGVDIGDGYLLLRAKENCEAEVIQSYLSGNQSYDTEFQSKITRWARIRLPNGQVGRSLWKEALKAKGKCRVARNVKLLLSGKLVFAEVYYYFILCMQNNSEKRPVALVSFYSEPHNTLLKASFGTVWSCTSQGDSSLHVVSIKAILSVVAMVPHTPFPTSNDVTERFFVVEKPGLDVAHMIHNNNVLEE